MKNKKSQIKFFVHNKYNAKVKKLKKKMILKNRILCRKNISLQKNSYIFNEIK